MSKNTKEKNADKIVKCRYRHCLHESPELSASEAVRKGNCYYHEDCLKTQTQIKEIVDLFVNYINPNPVFSQLQNVINCIVFKKKVGSDFLLFALKYYIQHKLPLSYPQGLYYIIQNKDVRAAYGIPSVTTRANSEVTADDYSRFAHTPQKNIGFQDIIK